MKIFKNSCNIMVTKKPESWNMTIEVKKPGVREILKKTV